MYIGWLPYLIIYFYWLIKRKPYRRIKQFEFSSLQRAIEIKRW